MSSVLDAAPIGARAMQRRLCSARWDADAVQDGLRSCVAEHLGEDGALIVDETGVVKKGR
ncbi:hypothetical protein AB0K16_44145 [Nonomuraea jabiensis]